MTMRKVYAILFVLGINIIVTIAQPNRRIRDIGFLNHVQRTKNFACKDPQLRSILARDLLTQPSPEEQFYPAMTVLARCDEHAGCCGDGKTCAPAEIADVQLVFIVNHLIDTNRPKHHEVIRAQNHTRCHCIDDSI